MLRNIFTSGPPICRVYSTLADLVSSLEEAQAAGTLKRRLTVLRHPSLLVQEELQYPLDDRLAVG